MEYPAFVGGSYQSQAVTQDQEDTWNWYYENTEGEGGTSRSSLYPTPGVTLLADASDEDDVSALSLTSNGRGRAMVTFTYANQTYQMAVIGTIVYLYSDTLQILTTVGQVAGDSNPATITFGGDGAAQVFITSGNNGYVYDLVSTNFTLERTGATRMGAFVDGYFLALDDATSTLYVSDPLDATTWDPTQFAQRSIGADPWISMYVYNRLIYLFGTETSEVWYNAGSVPFPLTPNPAGFFNYGISAQFSPKQAEGAVYWLGASTQGRGMVLRISGYQPETVSTYPVQYAISRYATIENAIGDAYNHLGHTHYLLTFADENVTWNYDVQTQQWTKRGTWISDDNDFIAWRPLFISREGDDIRCLDRAGSGLYSLTEDSGYDVEGLPIRRLRKSPCAFRENERVFFSSFELDLEPGLGLDGASTVQGHDPQVMMRYSDDGGKTWSNEKTRSAGKIGEYGKRVRWNRCGHARRRVFEVSTSDPTPFRITNAYIKLRRTKQQQNA